MPPASVSNGLPVVHDCDSNKKNHSIFGNGTKDEINLSCSDNKFQLIATTSGENKGDSIVNHCQWNQEGFKYERKASCQLCGNFKFLTKVDFVHFGAKIASFWPYLLSVWASKHRRKASA